MVTIKDVTKENYRQCIKIRPRKDQEHFVASNVFSIAQSKFEPTWTPKAIYHGDEIVGFLMYGEDSDTGRIWIIRFMIGEAFQGKGYGKEAMEAVLNEIYSRYNPDSVYISFEPENEVAKKLYMKFGFQDTGEVDGGEVVYCLKRE